MKYYICQDNKPKEVTESKYYEWEFTEKINYNTEDYISLKDEILYNIEIGFIGVFDDFEIPMPFVIIYTEKNSISNEDVKSIKYFETFEAAIKEKNKIITILQNPVIN